MPDGTVDFMNRLAQQVPAIRPIAGEHLADNGGEMLPYLLLDEISFAMIDGKIPAEATQDLLRRLESAFGADPEADNLIAVSFVESMPWPGQPGDGWAHALPPKLTEELRRQRQPST